MAEIALLKETCLWADGRFGIPLDIFPITTSSNYRSVTIIDQCLKDVNFLRTTTYCDKAWKSGNFLKVSYEFKPNRTYWGMIIPIETEKILGKDCLTFLESLPNVVLTGAQGLALLYSLKREKFPECKNTISFDKEEFLWKDDEGKRRVPLIGRGMEDDWIFSFGHYEMAFWGKGTCLLCFMTQGMSSILCKNLS
jgi:hypothetical protein